MASMPLELGSSSLSSLRCWRRRPGRRPAHWKGRHVVESSRFTPHGRRFFMLKTLESETEGVEIVQVCGEWKISATVICLRLKPHHWIEVWQKLMSIFPRKVLNNKQSNHPSIDLFVPGYPTWVACHCVTVRQAHKAFKVGGPKKDRSPELEQWFTSLRTNKKHQKSTRRFVVFETCSWSWGSYVIFCWDKVSTETGQCLPCCFCVAFFFGGKGIANKIGLHEKCCALTCIAWLREWIS